MDTSSSSIFSMSSRVPDDTVLYSIYPDFSLPSKTINPKPNTSIPISLHTIHLQILESINPYTSQYIWQHQPFNLSPSYDSELSHLHGALRFGDNLEDEWFVVFLLFHITRNFKSLSVRAWDTDGEFLLIESAYYLPRWVNPDNVSNRVFIRQGDLCMIPKSRLPNPTLLDSLSFIVSSPKSVIMSDSVQSVVKNRILEYPDRATRNVHRTRVRVPVSIAQVLKHERCFISLAVEGFYDRDIDTMKHASKMEKFLGDCREEGLVRVSVDMSRAMYAQLVQQTFNAPKCYPMPNRSDSHAYMEAEMGMKIACGFEMMYQRRRCEGLKGKGSTWEVFRDSLENSGYFQGILPGSKEYKRSMESAELYFRSSSTFSRSSEMMSAPVRRIDEILAVPHSPENFMDEQIPPADDDSWLYGGEAELNSVLLERQMEMEMDFHDVKHKKKKKSKQNNSGDLSRNPEDDFDLVDIAQSMQKFVDKVSSYQGAEVPERGNMKAVDFDADQFMKDIGSMMKRPGCEGDTDGSIDTEDSPYDMDFYDSEDESGIVEPSDDIMDGKDAFMQAYSDALNQELKDTSLKKSFVRATEQSSRENEESSGNGKGNMDDELDPVDVDVNLVNSLLDSFSSQQGLPGPASNLLGLMGLKLPQDTTKQ